MPAVKSPPGWEKATPVGCQAGTGTGMRQKAGTVVPRQPQELQAAQSRGLLEVLDKSLLLNPEALQQKQLCAICSINTQASQDAPELLPAAEAPRRGGRAAAEAVPPSHCQPCRGKPSTVQCQAKRGLDGQTSPGGLSTPRGFATYHTAHRSCTVR